MKERMKKYFAEFLGSMLLMIFGCGTAIGVGTNFKQGSGYILTALAFGLVFAVLYYSICKISGCHLNPAISFSMLLMGKMKIGDFFGYIIAQLAGNFGGCGLLLAIYYGHTAKFNVNVYYDDNAWISLLIEVILSFVFLCTVISCYCSEEGARSNGLICGAGLALVHIFGIKLTGCSVNPARSLVTAIFAGGDYIAECWVFLVAPLIAAVLAVLVCKCFATKTGVEESSSEDKIAEETNQSVDDENTKIEDTTLDIIQ